MSATHPDVPVQVIEVVRDDPTAVITDFLDAVDPKILERDVLDALSWDGELSMTAAVVSILRKYAQGG